MRGEFSISRGASFSGFATPTLKTRDLGFDRCPVEDAGGRSARRQARDERLKAFQALLIQPCQLDDRLRMVIDAKIERRVDLG